MNGIVIIDYGMGNIGSIENMIRRIGGKAIISSSKEVIEHAEKLILPGVGSYRNAVLELKRQELWGIIDQRVKNNKVPILCICLGAQLVVEFSEEGGIDGFGWIKGQVIKFDSSNNLKIPHMGWNHVIPKKKSRLFAEMPEVSRFYFVHSYHFADLDETDILTTTVYGNEFASSLEKNNIYAVQFHPEKSHKFGMQLFENFLKI